MKDGTQTQDPVYSLASALLTAELNLSAGAETCQASETAVISSQVILALAGFNGMGEYSSTLPAADAEALPVLAENLLQYNLGHLCK
jgi:hypothetical protein